MEDFVREKVEKEHWTHSKISEHLQQAYSGLKGFSVQSIERFCRKKEIRKTARLSEQELDEAVAGAISQIFCSVQARNQRGSLGADKPPLEPIILLT